MKHRCGFTLIELLVVIAIIALLVSILMPSLQKAKEMAKDVVCLSHQKNVALAIYLYAEDYEDTLPYGRSLGARPSLDWDQRVGRMSEDWDPRNATPGDLRAFHNGYIDLNHNSTTEGTFKCPSAWDQVEPKGDLGQWICHFSANGQLMQHYHLPNEEPHPKQRYPRLVECTRLSDIKAIKVVLLGDCALGPAGGAYPTADYRAMYAGYRYESELRAHGPWPYTWWVGTGRVDYYGHTGEKSNLTFLDGHAEGIKDLILEDFNPEARLSLY